MCDYVHVTHNKSVSSSLGKFLETKAVPINARAYGFVAESNRIERNTTILARRRERKTNALSDEITLACVKLVHQYDG